MQFVMYTSCIQETPIPGQLPSSNEFPGHFFPPPVGLGLVHDLVRTFWFPPQSPDPQPLHSLHGDQLPSTEVKNTN